MFVLGIDPGLSRCGYGLVGRSDPGRPAVARAAGVIETAPDGPVPARLAVVAAELRALVEEFAPDTVAVERLFFQVNVRTAVSVGQVSGLALVAAAEAGCAIVEYSANEVKLAVAGHGDASKREVQQMVARLLSLPGPIEPPDAADALALALCHLATVPLRRSVAAAEAASVGAGKGGRR
ncbi:MAG TPA: crossover junction endodeoxyribonuclease RuvC [Acidimicrobiales bacterium]|nr:crossover junction endodeoxyribonuclease RuvC [Acidimicrobiales bacterium]